MATSQFRPRSSATASIYLTSSHGSDSPVLAVRPSARGDVSLGSGETSNAAVVWSYSRGGSYVPSPLVYGDYLYISRDNGVLSCYTATTGERHYEQRLGRGLSNFSASMVATNGRIYVTSEDGDVYVVAAGPEFRLLATNQMNESCHGDAGDLGRQALLPHPLPLDRTRRVAPVHTSPQRPGRGPPAEGEQVGLAAAVRRTETCNRHPRPP